MPMKLPLEWASLAGAKGAERGLHPDLTDSVTNPARDVTIRMIGITATLAAPGRRVATPPWGGYVLIVLMTIFLIGALVFTWSHWEH
jgi:hypothetical protein